jgi:hypothetical protein
LYEGCTGSHEQQFFCEATYFIIDKPNTPPHSTDLSLFFHIIATSLYTFLPAFWEFLWLCMGMKLVPDIKGGTEGGYLKTGF